MADPPPSAGLLYVRQGEVPGGDGRFVAFRLNGFDVTGLALDDIADLLTLDPAVELVDFETDPEFNEIAVLLATGAVPGRYTATVQLPDGRVASTTFDFEGTVGEEVVAPLPQESDTPTPAAVVVSPPTPTLTPTGTPTPTPTSASTPAPTPAASSSPQPFVLYHAVTGYFEPGNQACRVNFITLPNNRVIWNMYGPLGKSILFSESFDALVDRFKLVIQGGLVTNGDGAFSTPSGDTACTDEWGITVVDVAAASNPRAAITGTPLGLGPAQIDEVLAELAAQ